MSSVSYEENTAADVYFYEFYNHGRVEVIWATIGCYYIYQATFYAPL